MFDHVPLLHDDAQRAPRSACHLQGSVPVRSAVPLPPRSAAGPPCSDRSCAVAGAGAVGGGGGTSTHGGDEVETQASCCGSVGALETAGSIFDWMRAAVPGADTGKAGGGAGGERSAHRAVAQSPHGAPGTADVTAAVKQCGGLEVPGCWGCGRGGGSAAARQAEVAHVRPPAAGNSWAVAVKTASPGAGNVPALRHAGDSPLAGCASSCIERVPSASIMRSPTLHSPPRDSPLARCVSARVERVPAASSGQVSVPLRHACMQAMHAPWLRSRFHASGRSRKSVPKDADGTHVRVLWRMQRRDCCAASAGRRCWRRCAAAASATACCMLWPLT